MTRSKCEDTYFFNELYFELTYKCTAKCDHCYLSCSPGVSTSTLPVDKWIEILQNAKYCSIVKPKLVIAGGEPTILYNDLICIINAAKIIGYDTAIITNAWWANSTDIAKSVVKELVDSGLSRVEISCSNYHQKFISKQNLTNAILAFKEYSIPVKVLLRYDKLEQRHILLDDISGIEYCEISEAPVLPIRKSIKDQMFNIEASKIRGRCKGDLSLTITPNGDVYPCCCGTELHDAFRLGNITVDNLDRIIERFMQSKAIKYISYHGPSSAIKVINNADCYLSKKFSHICLLCNYYFRDKTKLSLLEEKLENVVVVEEDFREGINDCFIKGIRQPSGASLLYMENYIIKSATNQYAYKLKQQAFLLKKFEAFGIDVVPKVIDMKENEYGFCYVMPRYTEIDQKINSDFIIRIIKLLKRIWLYKKENSNIDFDGYITRTYSILEPYDKQYASLYKRLGIKLSNQLKDIAPCFVHGDPTLENIAYNAEKGEYILLDPNPQFSPEVSIPHLDIAKLMQSFCGWESFVKRECFEVTFSKDTMLDIINGELGENQWPLVAWLMISHLIRTLPYGAKINNSFALLPSIQKNILTLERVIEDEYKSF